VSAEPTMEAGGGVDDAPSRRPLLLIALGLLAVVLVGAFLLFGGADGDVVAAAPESAAAASATEGSSEDAVVDVAAGIIALPTVTYDVYLARDPFAPVVPEPEPEPVAAEGSSTDSGSTADDGTSSGNEAGGSDDSSTDGSGGDPDDPTAPPTDGGSSSGCVGQDEVVCDGRVVTLVGIESAAGGSLTAVIQVDTTTYEVGPGETFADSFRVQAIAGGCVSLLYGDDGFLLCEGDRVLK
jgi:hypothetical protein